MSPHRVRVVRAPPVAAHRPVGRAVRAATVLAPRTVPRRVRIAASGRVPRAVPHRRRAAHRAWRKRGRRAQVSAIATLLGLLLVVTVLANYLSTQLPAQMAVNDGVRTAAVEDQFARLAGSLRTLAQSGGVGGVLTQPISLGSVGAPPFAGPDGGQISPGRVGTQLSVSYTVVGPKTFNPPGGWAAGGNLFKSGCTYSPAGSENPTTVSCKGSTVLTQNFTNGSHFISVTGGADLHLNFTASNSTVVVGAAGGVGNTVTVVGSHDIIFLNATGGSTVHMIVVGNHDTVSCSGKGGATVRLYLVGDYDAVSWSANGASSSFVESAWGSYDSTDTTNTNAAVYYTGFDAANPSTSVCPYANASSTDSVSGSGGTVQYNNTGYTGSGSSGGWTETWAKWTGLNCPFFYTLQVAQKPSGTTGATILLALRNTYAPAAQLAFDDGAVVYAQSGGAPQVVVAPGINYTAGVLTVWVPEFVNNVRTDAGVGTAVLSLRLVSVLDIHLPSNGFSLAPSSSVSISVTTPYAQAWLTYFATVPGLDGLATCAPATSTACVGPFTFNGPLATVTLTVPATSLSVDLATYAIGLT